MKNYFLLFLTFCLLSLLACQSTNKEKATAPQELIAQLQKQRILLPNGWSLAPAGKSTELGDFPMNLVASPSQKLLATTNNGQSKQSIMLIDATDGKVLSQIEIPKSWYGLKFSADEQKIYASGGNDNQIRIYSIVNQQLALADSIVLGKPWKEEKISPTGIELDEKKQILYAVTKEDSALYICNLADKKVVQKFKLPAEAYACALSPVKNELWISIWGGSHLAIFDTEERKFIGKVDTDSHPNDFIFTRNGKIIFVANGNTNLVSVIDTESRKVIETLTTSLFPDAPAGSTPNAVALSENEATLLIANADNNCLAVFDVSEKGESKSLGFIPTGWYPTSVKVIGKKIFVTNGKGNTSFPNPKGPNPYKKRDENTQYIGGLMKGSLSMIDFPTEEELAAYAQIAYENTPYSKEKEMTAQGEAGNPIPQKQGQTSPIKYVFYVIKENRTYDQIFGDIKEGNGDSSLCLFPERITPNHHALAREFVLLDNFYVDAEVSADGHNWSTAGYANDYVEKTWQTSYGGRGGTYDYEGSRPIAYPKAGFIWDFCKRAGISYRTYGEFACEKGTYMENLKENYDKDYPCYDLSIKDIQRFEKWKQDFDSLSAANAIPQFNIVRIGNDHTSGTRVGSYTPYASVADNDLALGKLVEYLSQHKIWKETAIFVLEDDAQNGPDHVDAHRSIALVISPYVKRKSHDNTMYSTAGMLRTMELILGLPPMSQYDAAATPMWKSFTSTPDVTPFRALPAKVDLEEKNKENTASARKSAQFNLTQVDAAPDLEFSEVIWKAIKGENSEMPPPRRGAFVKVAKESEEGEEE